MAHTLVVNQLGSTKDDLKELTEFASTVWQRQTKNKNKNGCKSPETPAKHIRVLHLKSISSSRRAAGNTFCSSAYEFPTTLEFGDSELPIRCNALQVIRSGYADGPEYLKFHHANHFMSRSFMQLWSVWLSCGMADSLCASPADWCPYAVDSMLRKVGDCYSIRYLNILMSGGCGYESNCARLKIRQMNEQALKFGICYFLWLHFYKLLSCMQLPLHSLSKSTRQVHFKGPTVWIAITSWCDRKGFRHTGSSPAHNLTFRGWEDESFLPGS